jgi:hypothetical protein
LGALGLFLLLFFFLFPWNPKESSISQANACRTGGDPLFAYEAIGSGGLALHPRHALGWVSRLVDELALIAYNSRPDVGSKEAQLLFTLKNGKELLTLSNGQLLFLKEAQQGKGLVTSEAATNLSVKPLLLGNGEVLVEATRRLLSKEGKSMEEKGEFIVSPQGGVPARYNPSSQPFMKELKAARGFAQDLLIQKYGGKEYASWSRKAVLEIARGSSTYACFVSPGDYLFYREGEWRAGSLEELAGEQPVAHITACTPKEIEMDVWDETGFYPLSVKIEMQPSRVQFKPEATPSGIRIRSSTQISCAFGKRRIILRQGDWLLKTPTGWRNLRRADEIENYLYHRLKGELFIFDAIEKEQGRLMMRGNLFDETRTQMQPLSLPIEGEKTTGKSKRKAFSERRMT